MQVFTRSGYGMIVVLLLVVLSACGGGPTASTGGAATAPTGAGATVGTIEVRDPWVRAMMAGTDAMDMDEGASATHEGTMDEAMDHGSGSTSAAYMLLVNSGDTADALISAATDAADVVELHTVIMENNVMRMRPVEQIEVPANGEAELKPGGYHVMLIGLTRDLNAGDMVDLTLIFANAGEVQVTVPVQANTGMDMSEESGH